MTHSRDWESIRNNIIGLGETSSRKSYYPELQRKLKELEEIREQLFLSESNLVNLFNSVSDAIFIIGSEGIVLEANSAMRNLYGVSKEVYKNYTFMNYSNVEEAQIKTFDELLDILTSKEEIIIEWKARRPIDNTSFPVELAIRRFVWYGQDAIAIAARDIAERVKIEARLRQSQKMDALGQLAGGVAHDFNNLLAGIIGFAELLQITENTSEKQKKYISKIILAAENAGTLTKKLLAFSQRSEKNIIELDCGKIILDTVEILRRTINKNIRISMEDSSTCNTINGDEALLQNAILNIGINASHAMPQGGSLEFVIDNVELGKGYCNSSPFNILPGTYLNISIRDSGVGIPKEIVSRIFEPFFTTKEHNKGTGLGLAMVYGAIQEHAGAITVYSEESVGTVFNIFLPVVKYSVGRKNNNANTLEIGTGTILLVDDDELVRSAGVELLNSLGYEVLVASNGAEGISIFEEFKNKINIIILDLIMPVMGGWETLKKIRELDNNIPVVIASGFSKEKDIELFNKQNVSGFLQKPFGISEVIRLIKIINSKRESNF